MTVTIPEPEPESTYSPAPSGVADPRVAELEQRVVELEAALARVQTRGGVNANLRRNARPLLLLAGTLLLALVPVLLVVEEGWFKDGRVSDAFRELWCRSDLLCHSPYPAYFALALPCLAALFIFVLWQGAATGFAASPAWPESAPAAPGAAQRRTGRRLLIGAGLLLVLLAARSLALDEAPGLLYALLYGAAWLGWLLCEWPLAPARAAWKSHWEAGLAFVLALGALVALMASAYAAPRFAWLYVVLAVSAGLNLLRHRREVGPAAWLMLLATVLYGFNINAWWSSMVGDEYSFFTYSRDILQQSIWHVGGQLFNGLAVYEADPYFSSLIQAALMQVLGVNGFGWRFGNVLLDAAAVGLFYLFLRSFVTPRTALFAGLLLAASEYIMAFGKIGYNNLQAFSALILALYVAGWAVRSLRPLAFVSLGAALGLCFYLYPAALYVAPAPLLLLLLYRPPTARAVAARWGIMAVSCLALVFPLLLQPGYWQSKLPGTFLNSSQLRSVGPALAHFGSNLVYAFFSWLRIPKDTHFVVLSYLDPLTAVFTALGLAATLLALRRNRFAVFLFASFVVELVLVGASHDREFPPTTRMFLMLPWFVTFAALGLEWVLGHMERLGLPLRWGLVAGFLAVAVIGLNLYQANVLARERSASLQSPEALILRLIERAQREEPADAKTYVFVTATNWTSVGLRGLPELYPIQARFVDVNVTGTTLPDSALPLLSDRNSLDIIAPWMDSTQAAALEPAMAALGKVACPIKTTTGDVRFKLWYTPGLEWLCQ
jgi:hypothetical protein